MIHSKVMVIDDKVLRIGSANINNRSMGTDTECDLTIEATSASEREKITHIRNRLIADHTGLTPSDVGQAFQRHRACSQHAIFLREVTACARSMTASPILRRWHATSKASPILSIQSLLKPCRPWN